MRGQQASHHAWEVVNKTIWKHVAQSAASVAERRVDPTDGQAYTRHEFVDEYGGTQEWERAAPLTAAIDDEACDETDPVIPDDVSPVRLHANRSPTRPALPAPAAVASAPPVLRPRC